jgi:hypothetical protein
LGKDRVGKSDGPFGRVGRRPLSGLLQEIV